MRKWQCIICGFIYDEAEGLESEGIAPGTKWEDIPDDWICPECGIGKEDFEMEELIHLVFLYCEDRYVTSILANKEE